MLLIPCPYCGRSGPRSNSAMAARRISRGRRSRAARRRRVGGLPLHPHQPEGPACRALAPRPRLRPLLQRGARHGQRPFPRDLQGGRAEARSRRACARDAADEPSASGIRRAAAASTAREPLRFRFDGTTLDRLSGRHARLGAARQRRPSRRPLVQVSPPARHPVGRARRSRTRWSTVDARRRARRRRTCARRRSSSTTGSSRDSQNRWPSLALRCRRGQRPLVAAVPRRLLLQDLHVAAVRVWKKALRAADPRAAGLGRAPDEPDPDRYASRFAHCDVLVVGAGPAGLAAALAAAESGARVILADEQAELGGSLLAEADATDRRQAGAGLARPRRSPRSRAHADVTLLPRTHGVRLLRQNLVGACASASPTISPIPRRELPRERLWQVRARQVVLAAGAIERPLVFAGNDRPGDHAGRRGAHLPQPLRREAPARAPSSHGARRRPMRAALDLQRARRRGRRDRSTARAEPMASVAAAARAAGMQRASTAHGHRRHRAAGCGSASVTSRASGRRRHGRRRRAIACDCLLMSGGWTPTVHLFSQSRGKLASTRRSQAFLPGTLRASTSARPAPAAASMASASASPSGFAAGERAAGAAGRMRGAAARIRSQARRAPAAGVSAPARGRAPVAARPSSTSRTTSPPRTSGSRCAKASARSSTSSATPPPAWRPTRARRRTSTPSRSPPTPSSKPIPTVGLTTFRTPYTPVTFGTLAGHDARRPVRSGAARRRSTTGRGERRRLRGCRRCGSAPATSRDAARTCTRPSPASAARCARAVGMFDASTLGKIEVVGPDAAEFLEPHVHQRLDEARGRALPLRPAAERGRLHHRRRRHRPARAGPLPRHHDHRRRGARPQHDGGLPPDRVAGPEGLAHLDHRAVGGDRRAGAEGPRGDRAAGRGHRPRRTQPSRTWRCAKGRVCGVPRAAVPRQLHRRARLRGQRAGRPRPRRLGGGLGRSAASMAASRLRHRDHARAARREGLHHRRPGDRRHGDARRRRPRLGDRQGQARLRRQALAVAPRHAGAPTASSSSAC